MNNINTIFYYAESLSFSDYITMLQSGEITYRTIVFAQAQKAIYKGGVLYGATDLADLKEQLKTLLDGQEVIQKIENIVNNHFDLDPQDLPTASTTKKGCIKVGSGLVMGNDEKLNVDFSNLPSGQNGIDGLDGLVEQIIKTDASARASKSNYGVVRVGDGIDVTNGIISVSLTKGDKGDKGDTGAKGDKGDTGDRGPAGPSYDDSYITSLILGNIDSLQTLLNQFNDKVKSQVESMLLDVDWMQSHWPSGSGSTSNFGQQDVESYLQTIGVWELNEAHTKLNAKWSKIEQRVDSISTRVASLELNSGSGGTTTGTALTAEQLLAIQKIDGIETAVNSLSSTYATFSQNEDKELKIIKWLSSALGLYSNQNATWTNLASAADNTEISQSGIAALQTRVDSLEQGLVAAANLSTLVQDEVTRQVNSAGFVAQSDLTNYATTQSVATMYATVDGKADQALASISAMVEYETESDGNGGTRLKNYGTAQDPIYKLASKVIIDADDITIGERESTGGMSWFSNHRMLSEAIKVGAGYWPEGNYASPFDSNQEYLNSQIAIYKDAIVLNTDTVATQFRSDYVQFGGYDDSTNMVMLNSGGVQLGSLQTLTFTSPKRDIYSDGNLLYGKGDPSVTITFNDITVPGTVTSNAVAATTLTATNVTATNLSVSNSFSATDDITAGGDIVADGDMTADNLTIRNNGNITMGTGGNITSTTFTVGRSGQQGIISYYSPDYQVKFDSGIWADGNSQISGDLEITGNLTVNGTNITSGGSSSNNNSFCGGHATFSSVSSGGSAGLSITGLTGFGISSDTNLGVSATNTLSLNGGSITANNTITTSSDERLKDVQENVNVDIEAIAALPVFNFKWNNIEDEKVHLGTSAQKVNEVFPTAVTEDENGYLSMDYSSTALASAVMVAKEVIELKKKNELLEARLAALEAKLG